MIPLGPFTLAVHEKALERLYTDAKVTATGMLSSGKQRRPARLYVVLRNEADDLHDALAFVEVDLDAFIAAAVTNGKLPVTNDAVVAIHTLELTSRTSEYKVSVGAHLGGDALKATRIQHNSISEHYRAHLEASK